MSYFSSILYFYRARPVIALATSAGAVVVGDQSFKLYHDWTDDRKKRQLALNTSSFTQYTLVAKTPVSSTSSIFTLRPPSVEYGADQLRSLWGQSMSLWSVQAKQPQLQIGREYTPLPPTEFLRERSLGASRLSTADQHVETNGDADIHLLIRREKNGEMTTYLHSLESPAKVHIRGPYHDVKIPPHVTDILFLAGGTGISPALQVAQIIASRPGAHMDVLWANRRREECRGAVSDVPPVPPVESGLFSKIKGFLVGSDGIDYEKARQKQIVEQAKSAAVGKGPIVRIVEEVKQRAGDQKLTVQFYVDEEDSYIGQKDIKRVLQRNRQIERSADPNAQRETWSVEGTGPAGAKLIIVSGPDGFVDYWAGKKRWDKGKEVQGPLAGVLGTMDLNGWKVWKL
jgi:hypothetical protein